MTFIPSDTDTLSTVTLAAHFTRNRNRGKQQHYWRGTSSITVTSKWMSAMASQITGVMIVFSTVCSVADLRKHKSSASLAIVRVIHSNADSVSIWWRHYHTRPIALLTFSESCTRSSEPFDYIIHTDGFSIIPSHDLLTKQPSIEKKD